MSKASDLSTLRLEPTIAVGVDRIVQVGNYRIAVYDRDGVLQWKARLGYNEEDASYGTDFWDNLDYGSEGGTFDARVIYDQFTQRFIVTILEIGSGALQRPDRILMAVSKGGANDPVDATGDYGSGTGAWYKWALNANFVPPGCTQERGIDYQGLAVTQNWIALTAVPLNWPGEECWLGHVLHVLRKPPIGSWAYDTTFYDSSANRAKVWTESGFGDINVKRTLPMPAHVYGSSSGNEAIHLVQLASVNTGGQAKIRIHKISDPFGTPSDLMIDLSYPLVSDVTGNPPDWCAQVCPPATDPTSLIAPSLGSIQNVVMRSGQLFFAHEDIAPAPPTAGGANKRVVSRWYVVNVSPWPAGPAQFGTLDGGRIFKNDNPNADRPVHLMYPLVGVGEDGSMGLFVTRVYARGYVNLYFTGRRASDPPNVLTAPLALLQASTGGVAMSAGWGEYEGIALDPTDPNRVWATGQLGRCQGDCTPCAEEGESRFTFHTAVGSYRVPATTQTFALTLQRQSGQKPASVTVKFTPPDLYAVYDDVTLNNNQPTATRTFPQGTPVTLRAPDLSQLSPPWGFRHWLVDGVQVIGQDEPRQISVTMDAAHTAIPVYLPSIGP